MKKNRSLVPDYYFEKFSDASAEFLSSIGVKGIVLDIDNTLEPYEHPTPGEHVLEWFKSLSDAGIKAAFVSNNNRARVELFNKELGLPAYPKAKKPFKKNLLFNAFRLTKFAADPAISNTTLENAFVSTVILCWQTDWRNKSWDTETTDFCSGAGVRFYPGSCVDS